MDGKTRQLLAGSAIAVALAGPVFAETSFTDDGSFGEGSFEGSNSSEPPDPGGDAAGGFDEGSFGSGSFDAAPTPDNASGSEDASAGAAGDGFSDGSFGDGSFGGSGEQDSGGFAETGAEASGEATDGNAEGSFGDADFGEAAGSSGQAETQDVPDDQGGSFADTDWDSQQDDGSQWQPPEPPEDVVNNPPPPPPPPDDRDTQSTPQVPPEIFAFESKEFGVPPTDRLRNTEFHAPTPTLINGGSVVSTQALVDAYAQGVQMLVIDVLGSEYSLPNALQAPGMASGGSFGDRVQQQVSQWLGSITNSNSEAPIVIYCSDPMCWLSHNAALRAIAAGYSNVYWYRGGLQAWQMAGLRLVPAGF